ncbi:MAG: serine hydrolase domain-containing protein [Bacteroidia bacterium]
MMQLNENGKFNGSVLVAKSGSIVYSNSLGYADGGKTTPLSSENLFGLGSIYKEFPAVAIMQLKEKGLLSLDDSLSKHLLDLPAWADQIQIKHLLQYSSGLPRVDWQSYFQSGNGVSQKVVLEDLQKLETLSSPPGTDYIYSNYNPFLLIRIVESLSGLDFKTYLHEEILVPYKINGIAIELKYPFEGTKPYAMPFNENFEEDGMEYELMTICASPLGLYQWIEKLANFEIIKQESVKQLSQKYEEGEDYESALGSCTWENGKMTYQAHHGSTGNYEGLIRNFKSEGLAIIILTNQKNRNIHEIADKLHELVNSK